MKDTPVWNRFLGGWQLTAITQLQAGLPFSVFHGAAYPRGDFNADGANNDRPNTPAFGDTRTGLKRSDYLRGMFTAAEFALPAPGAPGNLGRNTFRGPGYASTHLSLFTNFHTPWIGDEDATLQFRVALSNLVNRPKLGSSVGNLDSLVFGRSTSASDGRDIQFAWRFVF